MKIAMLLTNGFDPDPRVFKEAKTLTKYGHHVEILCWDRSGKYISTPTENLDGIKIIRFFGNAVYGSGYKQIKKFLDFKKNVFNYMVKGDFEALHCHDFDGLFIGYSINKKLKLKLVYDEHDLFDLYFSDRGGFLNKAIGKIIKTLEKKMLKKINTHIVVTPKMQSLYKKISRNVVLVNNAPNKGLFNDIEKSCSSKIRIGFIGSIRYYDELIALIDASEKYKDDIEVIVSGRGISLEKLKEYCINKENVKLTGGYTMSELEGLYKETDITYAFYPGKVAEVSMPNKFYESIITETPIIANGNTEFGEEVVKNGFGYSISGNNLKSELEDILSKLVNNKNEKQAIVSKMKALKENYYWEANEKILESIYK